MIEHLGAASTAYFGGRSESRIRLTPLPVRYVDFTSMYPTVFSLGNLWRWVVARDFVVQDATSEARSLLETLDRDVLHRPGVWPSLAMVFCRVRPAGELLPTRARYTNDAGAWTIGINHLHSGQELWFTLADLAAARLLGGELPPVIEAFRIAPDGVLDGVRPVELRGTVRVDPGQDLVRIAIEERQRVRHDSERLGSFLKTVANGVYGIFAEYQLGQSRAGGMKVSAHGLWPIEARVSTPEEPGEFSFPPLAATITGMGRLLLALLQADVEARGGSYLACDTDSLLVVAGLRGRLEACEGGRHCLADGRAAVRVLDDAELDEVLAGLQPLNPYAAGTVPSLVKIEDENFAGDGSGRRVDLRGLAISPKRYVLYELGPDGPIIRKASSHGLGLYRPPIANPAGWSARWPFWIEQVWDSIIREAEGLEGATMPEWLDLPAVSQLTITSPQQLAPFRSINAGREYRDRIKPFGFLLLGHVDPLSAIPAGMSLDRLTPVAPYTSASDELLGLTWVNRHDAAPLRVTTDRRAPAGAVRLKTYGDVLTEYRAHPDAKSGDPRQGQSHRGSRGVLPRLKVLATDVRHIGKESNRLDEEEDGALGSAEDVYVDYRDDRREWCELVVPRLRELRRQRGSRVIADAAGLSLRELRYVLNGGKVPRAAARSRLRALLDNAGGAS